MDSLLFESLKVGSVHANEQLQGVMGWLRKNPRKAVVCVLFLAAASLPRAGLAYPSSSGGSSTEQLSRETDRESAKETGVNSDPEAGRSFVITFEAQFDSLPRSGDRILLVSKFDPQSKIGWGIALHRFQSSLRPEVYWRTEKGGGYYVFNDINVRPKHSYSFSLVAQPEESLVLFLQESGAETSPQFLGGFDVSKIGVPRSGAEVSWREPIKRVLVAEPKEGGGGDMTEIARVVQGGPGAMSARFSSEEILFKSSS